METLLKKSDSTIQLMIDAQNYAQTILLQGKAIPWNEPTAYANHLKQTVDLLKPQIVIVRLDMMIKQELAENKTLVSAMGEKSRSGFALKTLMGDEHFKNAVGNLVMTATKMLKIPIAVQLPSPKDILILTTKAAKPDAELDFDDDDAENAAVYFADWLRIFTSANLAGLIFDEQNGAVGEQVYQPIRNTAEHYQWCIGVRRENEVIFSQPQMTIPILPTDYWKTGQVDNLTGTLFTEIASDAIPEKVLDYLANLQSK